MPNDEMNDQAAQPSPAEREVSASQPGRQSRRVSMNHPSKMPCPLECF